MKRIGLFLIVLFIFCGNSLAQEFDVKVEFSIKNAGLTVNGSFDVATIKIDFSKDEPEKIRISGQANVNSINTGIAMRDKHLQKEEYFDAEKYPSIIMKLIKVNKKDDANYEATFDLTIKGKTQKVDLVFTAIEKTDALILKTNFSINRRDFGVGGKSFVLGDVVKVNVTAMQRSKI
jgi:polyisoprenoid-binding protein YceI